MDTSSSRPENAPQGAQTLVEVLNAAANRGFDTELVPKERGLVRCEACGSSHPASELKVEQVHRLEGASDPADMMLVALARCPTCDRGGTATLGFGPNADETDTAVLSSLDLSDA